MLLFPVIVPIKLPTPLNKEVPCPFRTLNRNLLDKVLFLLLRHKRLIIILLMDMDKSFVVYIMCVFFRVSGQTEHLYSRFNSLFYVSKIQVLIYTYRFILNNVLTFMTNTNSLLVYIKYSSKVIFFQLESFRILTNFQVVNRHFFLGRVVSKY